MNQQHTYYTSTQLRLPIDLEQFIDVNDEVFSFCEVMNHIDLTKYLAIKECKLGRKRYDPTILLKVILFAFTENGYASVRTIEKLCKTDIRYMWILQTYPAPSAMTINNFMNKFLAQSIDSIFSEINRYIFSQKNVDTEHIYLDGTKIIANANRYSWVWKKSCLKNRDKLFLKISDFFKKINEDIKYLNVEFDIRQEYSIEYMIEIADKFVKVFSLDLSFLKDGKGRKKTEEQRNYLQLQSFTAKLKQYANQIRICGEERNSYSKTDHDATFMRLKKDHMGNDQLLPAYNIQMGICDQYIAMYDVKKYACDMDCFQPFMEKFHKMYGKYPRYPVADAGYGCYNNYLYCEEKGMEKFMKFSLFDKQTKNKQYRENPYRPENFKRDEEGQLVCPNGKKFHYLNKRPIRGNNYGRTEEFYQCEDCSGCPYKEKCCQSTGNRVISMNTELSAMHKEVLSNLNSLRGAWLRMNRSIQAEGTFGIIKWDRSYFRARRRGERGLFLEIAMISCGFNLHKYALSKTKEESIIEIA